MTRILNNSWRFINQYKYILNIIIQYDAKVAFIYYFKLKKKLSNVVFDTFLNTHYSRVSHCVYNKM